MDAKFSQRIKDVLSYSKEEAIRLGNNEIAPEHLMLGILREGEVWPFEYSGSLGVNLPVKKI
jgi:ATP-dependent Clp protease ATP-binding subunit ClpC